MNGIKKKNTAGKAAIIALSSLIAVLVILLILEASGVFYRVPKEVYPEIKAPEMQSEDVYTNGDYQYVLLKDGSVMIVSCGISDHSVTVITMPDQIDGHSVKAVGDACFQLMTWITRINVPEGVTYIGENAFYGCCFLDTVYLPGSLLAVQDSAFKDCDYLAGIHYGGTKEEWQNILVGKENTALSRASKFFSE